ncbi:DUF4349 domain-containing protein [Dokdonia sinensis]|uniref:DUF4349 domain-containing protein n=1 Tax=Dokdonia sinensis TaxID=2479847 RepID=A0A3M0GKR5_9FLAO|nr:DUF4349 domain-containing protein [Dokdonia sinensis]RMB63242.1 DUF4349 domain-containing protein [Dokdonia sinensis]
MRLLLLSCLLFLALSCENTNESRLYSEDYETAEASASDLNSPPPPVNEVVRPQQENLKIIKTGNLRFETQDLQKTYARIMQAIQVSNGYVQNDQSGKNYNQVYQNITVRVPTENFQRTIDAIAQGVDYFDEKTIKQQDVTEEFVDVTARLKAKNALEDRYLALLAKAKNVKEMLEIERELAQIREEIESAQGRLKYLQNKVSMSTINIAFYKNSVETKTSQSYGSKIVNALKSGWNGISTFFLGLLHVWPFLILVALGVFFTRRWMKKKKKK